MNEYKEEGFYYEPDIRLSISEYTNSSIIKKSQIVSNGSIFQFADFKNSILSENAQDQQRSISEFINFYTKYKFGVNDNIEALQILLYIIQQRNRDNLMLILSCFKALRCVLKSKIDSIVLINFGLLPILHNYLTNPDINDIIPSLKVYKYLLKSKYFLRVLDQIHISVFRGILQKFDDKKIDSIVLKILNIAFKITEKRINSDRLIKINRIEYQKNMREFFSSSFYLLYKEIGKYKFNPEQFKCALLNSNLDFLLKLVGNEEGYDLKFNEKSENINVSPMECFLVIINQFRYSLPVTKTLDILRETLNNSFEYFFFIDQQTILKIMSFFNATNPKIQASSIHFFFSLIENLFNNTNLAANPETANQIEIIKAKIFSELKIFECLLKLFSSSKLFFCSVEYVIQIFDIFVHYMPCDDLLGFFDENTIDSFLLYIDGTVSVSTLDSILNILLKMADALSATNPDLLDSFVGDIDGKISEDQKNLLFMSNNPELVRKAHLMFDRIKKKTF